jgi:cytochrome c peroxidase
MGALALLLSASQSQSADVPPGILAWQQRFKRPAEIPFPDSNPFSEEKSKLGRMLFFDPILSGSKTISCASCHNPGLSWGDGKPRAAGEKPLTLRSPTLLNIAWVPKLGWDGHFRDLESVAFGPITNTGNMNLPEAALVERLSVIPGYVDAFNNAFGSGPINRRKIELALATFERTIVSGEALFDHWIKGDQTAIDASAKRGFALFVGKARCESCHSGWNFTDSSFHDIGTARSGDIGRGNLFPTSVKLRHAFKTPTLRDVARRAPYMHDGSVKTLDAVVEVYNRGGIERPSRSELIAPLGLSKAEKADLIAFLRTLDGVSESASMPTLPR